MDDIAPVDWLAHRWPFEIRRNWSNGVTRYEVVVGRLNICAHGDETTAQAWIDGVQLESLALIVARYRELHPVQVLIEGRGGRLARIPPELWATYDGLVISITERCVGVLSAKARSLFDGDPCVFVRVYKIEPAQKVAGGKHDHGWLEQGWIVRAGTGARPILLDRGHLVAAKAFCLMHKDLIHQTLQYKRSYRVIHSVRYDTTCIFYLIFSP